MPIKGDILSAKYAPQIRIYDAAQGSSKLKGGITESIRVDYEVRVFWYAEPTAFDVFDDGGEIRRKDGKSFFDDGFAVGETFSVQFGYDANGQSGSGTISAISEDGFTIFSDISTLTNDSYDSTVECLVAGTNNLDNCIYRFGLIENEESFNTYSKLTGDDQRYYIKDISGSPTFGTISGNIKGWASEVESIFVQKNANSNIPINREPNFSGTGSGPITNSVLNYTIRHQFPLLPFYVVGQLDNIKNLIAPEFLAGSNSLKHIFEATFKRNISDEENNKQVRFQSIDGSVGFFDENFNGIQSQYSLISIEYFDNASGLPNDSLLVQGVTKVVVQIDSADGTFTVNTPIVAVHSYLPEDEEEYLESQDYFNENFAFESVPEGSGGSIVTGVNSTLVNANTLEVEIFINVSSVKPELTAESNYLLALTVENETLTQSNSDRATLLLDVNTYDLNPDIPDLLFVESQENFSWIDDTSIVGYNDFQGWIEDSILSKFEFKLDREVKGAVLNSFSYKIVAFNTITEEYFEIQSIPFVLSNEVIDSSTGDQLIQINADRGLAVGNNIFNTLVLSTEATRTGDFRHYTGQIATKIDWQEWLSLPNADTVFYDNSQPNNGLNKNSSNYSLNKDYELKGLLYFEVSQDSNPTITEYEHFNNIVIKNYDEFAGEQWTCEGYDTRKASDNEDLNGNIIDSEPIIIKAKFAPVGFTPDPADYVGMVRIEPQLSQGINQLYQIASNRPVDAGYPLIPLDGDNFASLSWDGTYLSVECQTNNNFFDISSLLPSKFSSRLWRTTAPAAICEIIFFTDVDNIDNVSANVFVGINSGWIYKGVVIVAGDTINQAIATADGTDQTLTYFTDTCDNITDVIANGNEFKGSIDLSELNGVTTIEMKETRQDTITFPTGNTNPITSLDLTRSDFIVIDLTDVNIGGSMSLGAITQVSPQEPLNSLIFPLNNNNVWSFIQIINTLLTTIDVSEQNNLGGTFRILSNASLTSLITGSSNETFSNITIIENPLLSGNLDLSGYPNILSIDISGNNLNTVTFANATSVVNGIDGDNNSITSLNFTPLGNNFSGVIRFENNNISSLTIPANSQPITRFDFSNNQLSTIDASMLTGLQGIIHFDNNLFTAQSDFNFGTITNVITNFKVDNNNISGVWDFTTFANVNTLGTLIDLRNNNITQIIYQASNLNIGFNYGANNSINTALDLTPLPNSFGVLEFQNNSIPSVILPSSSGVFTELRFNNNNIVSFDVTPLTGANNNINPLRLNSNDMTTITMDQLISDLVSKGWQNGNLIIDSQSTGQLPTSTAADFITLDTVLNWNITYL